MGAKQVIAKVMVVIGTVFVWAPLLIMLFLGVFSFLAGGQFNLDYLIPAEILPVWLIGAVLLIVGAILARMRRGLIIGSIAAGLVLLLGSQFIAVATGLATNPAASPTGFQQTSVLAGIIGFDISLIVTGNAGIALIRDLFKKAPPVIPPAEGQAVPEGTAAASGEPVASERTPDEQSETPPTPPEDNPPQPPVE